MTRPPVPLTPAQQQDLVQQIGQAAAAALPAGWQQLQVACRAAGRHVEVDVAVLAPDGRTYPVQPHPELPRLFGVLRNGMYQPGRGTWLSATLVFSPQRPPFADYQPDIEPRWRQVPPPIGFQDELRFFPREDRFVPPWLRQRAGAVPGVGAPQQDAGPSVPGQQVPPPVPGPGPAVPPPLPGAENQGPPPGAAIPPPLPGTGQAASTEQPAAPHPSAEPATPPPLPGGEQAANAEQPAQPQSPAEAAAPPPLPGTGQAANVEQPARPLPSGESATPPPGSEQPASAGIATPPLSSGEQAANAEQPAPPHLSAEPTTPPMPGGEHEQPTSAEPTAPPVPSAEAEQPVPPLPGSGQPTSAESITPPGTEAEPVPPTSAETTAPPALDAELPVSQPLPETAAATPPPFDEGRAALASRADEAQSEPSEVAAAGIAAEEAGASGAGTEEAQPAAPEADPAELRTPRVYDGFDEAGNPVVEREALSPEERERVLAYLDGAPIILASRSNDTDAFDPSRTDAVPLNFRTDGSWVWPGAVGYYLREHGISPDPELVAHIRAAGYAVPEVSEAAQERMLAAMVNLPAEESPPAKVPEAESPEEQDQLLNEIATALAAAAPEGWQRIVFDFMTLGRHANLACGARMADGSTQQVSVARELSKPLAQLRRGKYVQGRGTWYTLSLTIDPPLTYQASFNEDDEPAFHTPPRPEDYALDQERYPRDEDYLPLWFSARLPDSPQ
ncbi:hypothetical protein [Amycolatopsis sp. WGS_07]|uniref:hypothetical protein n=1 Tax=Amycolatopsis sp. WGS_07 TaxID=3076764 RepID=UPI003873510C